MVYTYVIYPLLLKLLSPRFAENSILYNVQDDLPFVAVCMAAYNEESVIREKLESLLRTDYPLNKIQIYIGSDASTDNTETIVQEYTARYNFIHLVRFNNRTGKTSIINKLTEDCKGDILVLTDANVLFEHDTIYQLVKHFKNTAVALVDSRMTNTGIRKEGISLQEKTYIQAEVYIKNYEGRIWGTMMGPFGGCYAMRKSYFTPVPKHFLVDDFFINMATLLKGGKCINEINALAYENASHNPLIEFKRKIRIAAGSFQNLFHFGNVLLKFNALAFCFFSHKVLRWLGPFFILGILTGSYLLSGSLLFLVIFLGTLGVIMSPALDYILRKAGLNISIIRFLAHFTAANAAQVAGLIRFLSGIQSGIWQPTVRNQ